MYVFLTNPFMYPSLYMMNLHSHCIVTLNGINNSYVSSLAISGKLIIVGSSDKQIRLFNRDELTSRLDHDQQPTQKGKGAVKCLVVLTEKLVFSAHQDHKIRVWQIVDNSPLLTHLATLPTLTDRASKALNPNNNVQIRRHKKQTWVHHVDSVSSLALSPDKSLIYSVSWDRTLKVWKTTNFKCLESVKDAHDDAINAVVVSYNNGNESNDHHQVFTGSADMKIKVWKKDDHIARRNKHFRLVQVATLEKHRAGVNALVVSSDGSVLYSGDSEKSIVVWTENGYNNMVAVGELVGHTKAILCLAMMGDLVCSGSADKSIRIWKEVDRYCYSCFVVLEGHRGPVKCLAATNSSNNNNIHDSSYVLYSGSLDCEMKVWQIFVSIP